MQWVKLDNTATECFMDNSPSKMLSEHAKLQPRSVYTVVYIVRASYTVVYTFS